MKIVKYLIKYCLNFALLMLVFFSSILYLFGVDDFEFSYRQICIILVAFIFQVFYYYNKSVIFDIFNSWKCIKSQKHI